MYRKYDLPEYPLSHDMWDEIAESKKPIAVYGMGNGADKLFSRLEKYGVSVSAVFASDGFVRGHSFRGYEVKTLAAVKEELGDVLILLSFATSRSEVLDLIRKVDSENDMLVPDMPVAGEEYFDKEFYNAHYSEIIAAYESLADEDSRNCFAAVINYKLFGRAEYLFGCFSDTDSIYALLPDTVKNYVDAGAYNGDTVRELIRYKGLPDRIYAFEPDSRNFRKLSAYKESEGLDCLSVFNAAVWSEDADGVFVGSGNRNSSVNSTSSYKNRQESIALMKIDTAVADSPVEYIKYDVEGAELEALIGTARVIERNKPALLVSAYHRSEDVFKLVGYLKEKYPDYSLYMRRTLCLPAWEIAVIAVKRT